MRSLLSLLTVSVIVLSASTAQAQLVKHWDRTYGGNAHDGYDVVVLVPTTDGGCLIGGSSKSDISGEKTEANRGDYDYWVVKVNAAGNKQWDRTFGGTGYEKLEGAQQTPDGGYVLVGWSQSGADGDKSEPSRGGSDYWVIRLDAFGNKLWDKTLGGPGDDRATRVLSTNDGGFFIWGVGGTGVGDEKTWPSYGGYAGWDGWLVKIDANGNKLKDWIFGGDSSEVAAGAIKLVDGTLVIGGYSYSGISGNKSTSSRGVDDFWAIAIDDAGNKLWEQAYGGDGADESYQMIPTSDGGFAMAGTSTSGVSGEKTEPNRGSGHDLWLVKADKFGNKQWDRTVGTAVDEFRWRSAILQAEDGGYLIGGASPGGISGDRTDPSRGADDYWLVRFDSTGNKLWNRAIGGAKYDHLHEVARALDGGYFIAGASMSGVGFEKSDSSRGGMDLWLVKAFELSTLEPSVSGKSYVDVDNNCTYNPIVDSPLANRVIQATPGPYFAQSDNDGEFMLRLPSGNYSVMQANVSAGSYEQTCPGPDASFPVTAVSGVLTPVDELGNKGLGNGVIITTTGIYPSPLTSPCWGQANEECVTFFNDGAALVQPKYTIDINGGVSNAQVNGASATSTCNCMPTWVGNTVSCNLSPALPANSDCTICVIVDIPPWPQPPLPNESITVTSSIAGTVQNQRYITSSVFADPIKCSYDPNDRTLMQPAGCGDAGFVPSGQALTYRTRFQNLGNAPAHNVVIEETLSDNLDPVTFKIVGTNKNLTRAEIFPGNRLILSFSGIELPDATTDLLGSIGTVMYSIQPKTNLIKPLPIRTQAAIFFDLNDPVITNETLTTVVDNLPPVSFDAPSNVCVTDAPFALSSVSPTGGTYSGDGVVDGVFDPAAAGVGAHAISYSHTASIANPSYTLNQVGTFAPISGSGTTFTLADDQVSDALPVGFMFNFYGKDYSQLRVSSNGFITFNDSMEKGCCAGPTLPNGQSEPSNLIAYGWDDLFPGPGAFDYFTTGTEPNRVFILNVANVAQVRLYEGTNLIEIHTITGTSYNGMTEGIENDGGTLATVVPGRNGALFSIANDFVQFIPPASATFCSDGRTRTIDVHALPVASITASGSKNLCAGESIMLAAAGGTSYSWSTGESDSTIVATSAGTYSVVVTNEYGCSATVEATVIAVNPNELSLSCIIDLPGVCAAGTTTCASGEIVCVQNVQPSNEICDGLDNDCDGQIDEDAACQEVADSSCGCRVSSTSTRGIRWVSLGLLAFMVVARRRTTTTRHTIRLSRHTIR